MVRIILAISLLLGGCGTASKAYRVIEPREIDKESLARLQPVYTKKYGLPFVITEGVDQSLSWWSAYIDTLYTEYEDCVKRKLKKDPGLNRLKGIKIIVVNDSKFDCKYHGGRCSGEYDSGLGVIIVARKDIGKSGFVPLLKHEWSHANGILRSDHSNHDHVKRCTRY